jgi:O-antigen/teichoic acid export membrane protein
MNFFSSHNFNKYFTNISWLMSERLLRMCVGLVVGVYVARYLGPEQFGLLSYVGSFVALFIPFAHLGLNAIVVRELVKKPENHDLIVGTVFCLKVGGWLAMILLVFTFIPFTGNSYETNNLVFLIAGAVIFQAFNVIDFSFQASVRSKYVVQAQAIQVIISSVMKLFLVYLEAPLIWFAWVFFIDGFVLALGLIINYSFRVGSLFKWRCKLSLARKLLLESWPLILSGSAIIIQAHIDQVMLNEMINSEAVGQYSVAMQLTAAFSFLPMIVCSTLAPAITNAKQQSDELFHQYLAKMYKVMFILFLVVAIPLFFFASPIVILLFGDAYSEAGILLQLLMVRLFFSNFGVARSVFITNEKLFRYAMLTAVAGTVVNVSANWILIPEYGSKGAIVATIISFAVTTFVIDFFYVKTRKNTISMFKGMLNFWNFRNE